jgi:hypothetical protein
MAYPQITDQERDAVIVASKSRYVAIPGLVGLLLYAALYWHKGLAIVGMGMLVAVGSLMAGGLVGFLFGVPKSADGQKRPLQSQTRNAPQEGDNSSQLTTTVGIRRNTNIEEISDWLTKIIVGLGIYELKKLPELVTRLARFLSPGFADVPGADALAIILVVSFGATGFLLGFILTVLFLTRAIEKATSRYDAEASLKEDVRIARLVGAVAPPTEGTQTSNVRNQVLELCNEYVTERASRPPGNERTRIMEGITRKMRSLAVAGGSMLDELAKSESAGQRLAATAFLQVQPNANYIDWLISRFPNEAPFVQYQIAQALLAAVRGLSGLDRGSLRKKIADGQKLVPSGTDRYRTLQQAIDELA